MHDGSVVRFLKVGEDYDPSDRVATSAYIRRLQDKGLVATGLLYLERGASDMHSVNATVEQPLTQVPYEQLCPGSEAMGRLMTEFR